MLSKKSKENPILLEARKVLLNRVSINENDRFVTVDEFRFQMWGAADGEASLRFWGVAHRERIYESELDNKKVLYRAQKRMNNMGRGIDFRSKPDAAGCIVRTYIFYPVVLAFYENEDGFLELAAFTPRWLTSGLVMAIVMRKFDKNMKDLVTRSELDEKGISERFFGFISEKKEGLKEKKAENKKKKIKKKKAKALKKQEEKKAREELKAAEKAAENQEAEDLDENEEVDVLSIDWSSDTDE